MQACLINGGGNCRPDVGATTNLSTSVRDVPYCDFCPAGEYLNGGICVGCPSGSFCAGKGAAPQTRRGLAPTGSFVSVKGTAMADDVWQSCYVCSPAGGPGCWGVCPTGKYLAAACSAYADAICLDCEVRPTRCTAVPSLDLTLWEGLRNAACSRRPTTSRRTLTSRARRRPTRTATTARTRCGCPGARATHAPSVFPRLFPNASPS